MVRLRNAVHSTPWPADAAMASVDTCKPTGIRQRLSMYFRRSSITSPLAAARRRSSAPNASRSRSLSPPADVLTAIDSEIVFGVKTHALRTSKGVRAVNEDRIRVITSLERFGAGLLETEKKRVRSVDDALRQHVVESYASKHDAPAFDTKKLNKLSKQLACDTEFYGVYDGHGGAKCSALLALLLPLYLLRQADFASNLESAAKHAHLEMNNEILAREAARQCSGGSTAITLLMRRGVAYVCNTGDCRAILVSRRGVQALTTDHKATNEAEKQRIENAGGMVLYVHGVARVNGHLAVARAFGNADHRDVVIATPDVTAHEIASDDEYVVLASDGLWDALSNDDVMACIRNHPWLNTSEMAKVLVDRAIEKGSADNVTVLIVDVRKRL